MSLHARISQLSVAAFRLWVRLRSKAFSLLISGSFAQFGKRTVLMPPLRLVGERRIAIGTGVFIGPGSWLQVFDDNHSSEPVISIGDGASIVGDCVISAAQSIRLDDHVLMARNVYISDHSHKYSDTRLPILAQGIEKIASVHIKRGAWLGQNVVICPGVTVGIGSVVGANSVVRQDVPDFSIAVGAPARIVKTIRR
jgi:acetyltransferase-like isoleucine patch superfamily enzyme